MCIHPCCCVLLLCNFHHLCNAPGDKNAAKQAAHLISCNWLPFYRPCSFASQTFIWFADFLIIAFKIMQKADFIIPPYSTLHKENITALMPKKAGSHFATRDLRLVVLILISPYIQIRSSASWISFTLFYQSI